MSRFSRFSTTLALVGTIGLSAISAQNASDKHVFVTVFDKAGLPIEGLTTEHFAIMESGRERKVLRAEPLQIPMHVALLVDTSAVAGAHEPFKAAVLEFAERMASLNMVAVYSTGDRATLVVPFTKDAAQLRTGINGMFNMAHTRSAVVDGIDRALQDMSALEIARPVIISISSEAGEASGKSAGSVIKRMIAQSAAFHSISLAAASSGGANRVGSMNPAGVAASSAALTSMMAAGEGDRERNQLLEQGTKTTGGGRQRITNSMALKGALHRIGNELSTSYRVTFERSGSDKVRDLQVGLYLEDVTVRATPAPFGTR